MIEATLINAGDASGSLTSAPQLLGDFSSCSVQFVFSNAAALAGTCNLDGSNDGTNWTSLGTAAVTAGASKIISNTVIVKYIRATWANTSSTGTLTAKLIVAQPTNRY